MKQIFEAIWNATPWQLATWLGTLVMGLIVFYVVLLLLFSRYHL